MRRLCLVITVVGALSLAATGAIAGGPPVVNQLDHFVNEPFDGVGLNCASGNDARSDGHFTGVIHTLVLGNGSLLLHVAVRGTDTLYDLPDDGIPDATSEFVNPFKDFVFSSGKEIHTFMIVGTLTVLATGEEVPFHLIAQLVLDENGDPKVDFVRIACD
jgi:hypothetical protein